MYDFMEFTTEPIKKIMKEILTMAKVKKWNAVPEELTEDALMEKSASEPGPNDEEDNMEKKSARKQIDIIQSGKKGFNFSRPLLTSFMT